MTNQIPIGIAYPIQRGPSGYFEQSFTSKQSIKDSLTNLILTPKKTRPGRPEYGSSLYEFLFQPMSELDSETIQSILQEDIDRWIPSIKIYNVSVLTPEEFPNSIDLVIKYQIKNTPITDELSISLQP